MSLVDLQVEVETYRTAAENLTEEFTRTHEEVAADHTLTNEGKWERLEPLHTETVEQINDLRAREKTAVKNFKEKLERKVYGLSPSASTDPAKIVSYRDAQARARDIQDSDEAEELYQSALRGGDNIMATAILEKALVRGWTSIKRDYLERNSTARNDLDDLEALARFTDNAFASLVHYVPPQLNLKRPAGFPNIPSLFSSNKPAGVRPLREGFGTGW